MKDKKILILGGTGFLGINFVKKFYKQNYITVICFRKPLKNQFFKKVKYVNLDLRDFGQLQKKVSLEFEYVINFSGYVDHSSVYSGGFNVIDTHFVGLMNLIKHLLKSKSLRRFINIGSSDEYGSHKSPQKEEFRELPFTPYSFSKTAATYFLQMAYKNENFPAVICRLFLSYGPYQDINRLIPQVIIGCLKDKEFPVSSGIQYRDFCYIDDVLIAVSKLLTAKKINGNVFNIASGKPVKVRAIILKIRKLIGKGYPIFGSNQLRNNESKSLYANINKIKKHIDWKPHTSLDEGLNKTIDYFRKNFI